MQKMNKCILITLMFLISFCSPLTIKSNTQNQRTQKDIQNVVNSDKQRLKKLYEEGLKRNPNISGKLKVKFVIEASGIVKNVIPIDCSINDTLFVKQFIELISNWKFIAVQNGTDIEVVYPFRFEN